MGWPDISFGVHICMKGRVDIHFLKWILSIGVVPIYEFHYFKEGRIYAASNSYHAAMEKSKGNSNRNFRAGVPGPEHSKPA